MARNWNDGPRTSGAGPGLASVGEFGVVELDTGIVNQVGRNPLRAPRAYSCRGETGPALPADRPPLLAEFAALLAARQLGTICTCMR